MYSDPIAFFLTWTCYGTWLPGDHRGSTRWHRGFQPPQPQLEKWTHSRMKSDAVLLTADQRSIVEATVQKHVEIRKWYLHQVNCRTNHCHVVVTAQDYSPDVVLDQLKSWCKRKLTDQQRSLAISPIRDRWWTRGGSRRLVFDEETLAEVVAYVRDAQDAGGSSGME